MKKLLFSVLIIYGIVSNLSNTINSTPDTPLYFVIMITVGAVILVVTFMPFGERFLLISGLVYFFWLTILKYDVNVIGYLSFCLGNTLLYLYKNHKGLQFVSFRIWIFSFFTIAVIMLLSCSFVQLYSRFIKVEAQKFPLFNNQTFLYYADRLGMVTYSDTETQSMQQNNTNMVPEENITRQPVIPDTKSDTQLTKEDENLNDFVPDTQTKMGAGSVSYFRRIPVAFLICIGVLFFFIAIFYAKKLYLKLWMKHLSRQNNRTQIIKLYHFYRKTLKKIGYTGNLHDTPSEFAEVITKKKGFFLFKNEKFKEITMIFEQTLYGKRMPSQEDCMEYRNFYFMLLENWHQDYGKVRYLIKFVTL